MFRFEAYVYVVLALVILGLGFYVFHRVRDDYRARTRLTAGVAALQTSYFCLYALSSYLFLDSRISVIRFRGAAFVLALALMAIGLAVVALSMPALGRRSFGHEVGRLRTDGLYRFSRNPQLVGGFLLVVGYGLLWPAWQGVVWAALWLPIAALMVRGEEEHLARVFGEEYSAYSRRTPRFIGWHRG